MVKTWVYADPHFGHQGVCDFKRHDGTKLRPWIDQEHMTRDLIERYNEIVSDEDRVYFLGDVAMTRRGLDASIPFLKGRKVLVKGNHDIDKLNYYAKYFEDIRACVTKKGFIMTHIPIHPGSMGRWKINIHGHLHYNRVGVDYYDDPDNASEKNADPRYVCVSVEHTDYRPVELTTILQKHNLGVDFNA